MIRPVLFIALAVSGCGGRVDGDMDASPSDSGDAHASNDSATKDGSVSDGSTSASSDGAVVTCGPNTCHAGEICCNAKCGVCTFPDECVVHDCGGP